MKFLNWKDILKAEIQVIPNVASADGDVNVELEDDDCIRWVKKLIELVEKLPTTEDRKSYDDTKVYFKEDLLTEELACEFKKLVNTGRFGRGATTNSPDFVIYAEGLGGDSSLQNRNTYVFFDISFDIGNRYIKIPKIKIDLVFILTANPDTVLSMGRVGRIELSSNQIDDFERQINKICRHCSWQPTGLNKFFTKFRNYYNNDNVEKTTGAVTTSSPSANSGKLFNISYGGKKRGKKRQSKKEDN